MKNRIKMNDTIFSILIKLTEGNPGAAIVCTELFKKNPAIDPDDVFEGFGPILQLDTHGIYGPRIWMLYKDVCGENLVQMVAVLRSVQLGFITDVSLNTAIDNYGKGLDLKDIYTQVKERLPKFADLEQGV